MKMSEVNEKIEQLKEKLLNQEDNCFKSLKEYIEAENISQSKRLYAGLKKVLDQIIEEQKQIKYQLSYIEKLLEKKGD
jgi:DNA-binding ferritin-like protein